MHAQCGTVNSAWVDQPDYFGPDRRHKLAGVRLRERRRVNLAGPAPSLETALRKLRHRVLSTRGEKAVMHFAEAARHTAALAHLQGEDVIAERLQTMARWLYGQKHEDVRPHLYWTLDKMYSGAQWLH